MTAQLDIAQRPANGRLGQGTVVEQSRAVAEVQGAIVVAQQVPRDITRAERDMRRSCAQKSLAERAFFRYERGGSQISGPSVQLARELARCFGNMQFGLVELRRDDAYGQSEMQAWAWDVQTNTRSSTTFIVQHVRDTRQGTRQLTDQRDIYENNANNGARRLREMIFAILPGWYTEDAVAACYETLAGDEGELPERIVTAIKGFATRKVTAAQLEQKLGAPQSKWTPYDLAQLSVIYRSIQRGEIRAEDEFPAVTPRLTAADVTGKPREPENPTPAAPAAATERTDAPATAQPAQPAGKAALDKLADAWARIGITDGDEQNDLIAWIEPQWSATRKQVTDLAKWLDGFMDAAKDDKEEARHQVWTRYHEAHPKAGDDGA